MATDDDIPQQLRISRTVARIECDGEHESSECWHSLQGDTLVLVSVKFGCVVLLSTSDQEAVELAQKIREEFSCLKFWIYSVPQSAKTIRFERDADDMRVRFTIPKVGPGVWQLKFPAKMYAEWFAKMNGE